VTRVSAEHLRQLIAASGEPLRLSLADRQYHEQIRWTCDLLELVDMVADPLTAEAVTALAFDHLAGQGAADAAARIDGKRRMLHGAPPLWPGGGGGSGAAGGQAPNGVAPGGGGGG
jgi:hypothetical protein